MSRRGFVAGTIAASAAAAMTSFASDAWAEQAAGTDSYQIADTMGTDIVIVGGGLSGLCAAVKAAEEGASVIVLEKLAVLGGNGSYTDGPSGFDTKYSRAAGVVYDYRDAAIEDQHMFNFIPNIHYYIDMAVASSDNIDFVADHGVPISPIVDNFKGGNPTAHHWGETGGTIDPVMGRLNHGDEYTSNMVAAAEGLGVQLVTSTPAVDILLDGDAVTGVIAQREDGSYIQVNAKATILATGGIAGNQELMTKVGRPDPVVSPYTWCPGTTGDGYLLAMKAGAFDMLRNVGFIEQPAFAEMGLAEQKANEQGLGAEFFPNRNDNHPIWNILKLGKCIWVNERGERFADEACAKPDGGVAGWATNAFLSQQKSFAVFDGAMAAEMGQDCIDFLMSANEYNTKFTADTLEELAEKMEIPYETLQKTVDEYNGFVEEGVDHAFGKYAEGLVSIGDGPYYATRLGVTPLCSIGGARVTREMQAADVNWNTIPGLFIAGDDSFPFYTQMYYYQLPGSAVAYALHSGIVAATSAVASLA